METIYNQIIANKQKALIGFAVTALGVYFAKHGFDIATLTVKEAIELLLYGIAGYVAVYLKRNK